MNTIIKNLLCVLIIMVSYSNTAQNIENKKVANVLDLKWLEGQWKGEGDGLTFYEEYKIVNDTLIKIDYYGNDASFKIKENTGLVYISNGFVFHQYGKRSLWKSKLDSTIELKFQPFKYASNSFIWRKVSDKVWHAKLGSKTYIMNLIAK